MKTTTLILSFFVALFSLKCKKEQSQGSQASLRPNDTLTIAMHQTLANTTLGISLRMDTVLSDSRCPSNANCIWAGDAAVRFWVKQSQRESVITLHTNLTPRDTFLGNYRVRLIKLSPYPNGNLIQPSDYKAHVRLDEMKPDK